MAFTWKGPPIFSDGPDFSSSAFTPVNDRPRATARAATSIKRIADPPVWVDRKRMGRGAASHHFEAGIPIRWNATLDSSYWFPVDYAGMQYPTSYSHSRSRSLRLCVGTR